MSVHRIFTGQKAVRALLSLAMAALLSACGKKEDPAVAARRFFELTGAGKPADAYAQTAFGFKARQNEQAFVAKAGELGLTGYTALTLEPPEPDGSAVKLRAEVTTRTGRKLPFVVTLTREEKAWRVYSLRSPRSAETGLSEISFSSVGKAADFRDAQTLPLPDEETVRRLIESELMEFNRAVQAGAFDAFYDHVSVKWQERLTKGMLQRAFQPFIDQKVNIAGIKGREAILDRPATITSEGLLSVSGHYPTKPNRLEFALKFYYELPNWKLFGLDVSIRK